MLLVSCLLLLVFSGGAPSPSPSVRMTDDGSDYEFQAEDLQHRGAEHLQHRGAEPEHSAGGHQLLQYGDTLMTAEVRDELLAQQGGAHTLAALLPGPLPGPSLGQQQVCALCPLPWPALLPSHMPPSCQASAGRGGDRRGLGLGLGLEVDASSFLSSIPSSLWPIPSSLGPLPLLSSCLLCVLFRFHRHPDFSGRAARHHMVVDQGWAADRGLAVDRGWVSV